MALTLYLLSRLTPANYDEAAVPCPECGWPTTGNSCLQCGCTGITRALIVDVKEA
jgi:hypothetical protein